MESEKFIEQLMDNPVAIGFFIFMIISAIALLIYAVWPISRKD